RSRALAGRGGGIGRRALGLRASRTLISRVERRGLDVRGPDDGLHVGRRGFAAGVVPSAAAAVALGLAAGHDRRGVVDRPGRAASPSDSASRRQVQPARNGRIDGSTGRSTRIAPEASRAIGTTYATPPSRKRSPTASPPPTFPPLHPK